MITTTSTETVSTAKLTLTIYITIGIVGSGLYEYVLIKCFLSNLFTNFLDDEFLIIPGISFHNLPPVCLIDFKPYVSVLP